MPRSGTLVICVQNLDFSGANQVVLNIVAGRMHESNVVVVSPKIGSFAARFVDSGAAVRVGDLLSLLFEIRDVFCILCNTIMTADTVVKMASCSHPIIWILHEWWDDDTITENLKLRNMKDLTLNTVKQALERASTVVCVCESQRRLYSPTAPSSVIFVGVPDPAPRLNGFDSGNGEAVAQSEYLSAFLEKERACGGVVVFPQQEVHEKKVFTFLCLGIICPRKNQVWTVQLFKQFAGDKQDVRLVIVGARRTRLYEIEYLERVREAIAGDPRIELHDVTDNVDMFFAAADALVLTSLNEVTPMVISEAMSWYLPVLSTNIAGIKEMYTDGVEGFLFAPGEDERALQGMRSLYGDPALRADMSRAARRRFEQCFDLNIMVDAYQRLVMKVAPPVILLDMDGALVDWDRGFMEVWDSVKAPVHRERSYFMEQCVGIEHHRAAELLCLQKGFFEGLPPMEGALEAVREMESEGLQLYICTSPILASQHCAQEKFNWVRKHLGEKWLSRLIITADKTVVRGDILIDDKPYEAMYPGGKHSTATWKQVLFDAPYNQQPFSPRLMHWRDWRAMVYPLLGKSPCEADQSLNHLPSPTPSHVSLASQDTSSVSTSYRSHPPLPNISRLGVQRNNKKAFRGYGMSASEVQRAQDSLQMDQEPLSPEDIASIVSGSVSLLEDDDYPMEELLNDELGIEDIADLVASASTQDKQRIVEGVQTITSSSAPSAAKAQKRWELQGKLLELSDSHKREVESRQRRQALDSDVNNLEGLQIFRPSYRQWRKKQPAKSNIF